MSTAPSTPPVSGGRAFDTGLALELFSIAGSLNSTPDLDFLLEKIGAAAERLLDSEASAIMLVTDDKRALFFKVAGGSAGAKLKTMTLPIGKGIAGWVAQHGKPEVVNDTRTDPRFAGQFDKASGFITRSLLAVPMFFRGELVGVCEVLNKKSPPYTPEDIGLLSALANLASVAVTNTRIIQDQKNFFSHVLELLVGMIEISKPRMVDHPNRTSRLACAIVRAMGGDDYDYRMMYYAGLLHDIGYVGFKNPKILAEVGILNPVEEQHPLMSVKMLEGIRMLDGALPIIKHHHERWDGQGYPGKLKGEEIPVGARILGLVEVLEDLRMNAGVPPEQLREKAVAEIKDGKGKRFWPDVVDVAVELLETQEGLW
ncbi:GAF domain-containing protein [bacterium]|nr:MAG: GAF domain-containing protein [bacterium]